MPQRAFLIGAVSLSVFACQEGTPPPPTVSTSHPPHTSGFTPLPPLDASSNSPVLPRCEGGTASAAQANIDDFADGDSLIVQADGRNGVWSISNDGTGQQIPASGSEPRPLLVSFDGTETFVIHTSGSAFTGWGAALGFTFESHEGELCQYNAALYQGVEFVARGVGQMRIEMSVPQTLDVARGGLCTGKGCGNQHGFPIELSPDWTRYRIGFNQLAQEPGWGQPALFDIAKLLELRFRAPAQEAFDLWLEELRFFPDLTADDGGTDASTGSQDGG